MFKDAGNDLVAKVLLLVTQLCIVSNNSYTNIGIVWNITKFIGIIFLQAFVY